MAPSLVSCDATLVFVYNGDSGIASGLIHYLHKIVSPSTYECSLCALTYSPLGRRAAWERYLAALDMPVAFLHRDELRRRYPATTERLPAVFLDREGTLELVLGKVDLDACRDLDALTETLDARLGRPHRAVACPAPHG
jgi:hypothetical protein